MEEVLDESLVLAAGCFWGVEELMRALPGVIDTVVGYTGGDFPNPTYLDVKTGKTGHAEAIKISFNPKVTTASSLLEAFFKLHDPTTLNRQGNDCGSQYRSAIFYANEEQKKLGQLALKNAQASGRWDRPIVTTLEPAGIFYPAEPEHQDYLQRNPQGYSCHYWRD